MNPSIQSFDCDDLQFLILQESWHAQLRAVVEEIDRNFREYFKDIGCMGEVVLVDHDEVQMQCRVSMRLSSDKINVGFDQVGNRKTGTISKKCEFVHHDIRRAIRRCKALIFCLMLIE